MTSVKVEFAVQMTCQKCVSAITSALNSVEGIDNFEISLEKESVIVQTSLPSSLIKEKLEATGRRVVLKGYGSETVEKGCGSAVAMLGGNTGYSWGEVKGVVRLVQMDSENCIIDGTIDGLTPGLHGLHVHECGDLSNGCENLGGHFALKDTKHGGLNDDEDHRHTGDLGNVVADENGRATFRLIDKVLKVWDVIGRSLVVTEGADDLGEGNNEQSLQHGNSGKRISCGIISRSAGLNENQKQICACDGVSIWNEKIGATRKQPISSTLCTYL